MSSKHGYARWAAACLSIGCLSANAASVSPKDPDKPASEPAASASKPGESVSLEPFLPAKSVRQSALIAGKKVEYILTVGSIPLKDEKGIITGEVVYTSYVVPSASEAGRAVTFAMNGGPGAASAYLNLGVLGPKHINFGRNGVFASDSAVLTDNTSSWLDFTDLVFIDPIGTGYSRSHLDQEGTKKTFLRPDEDIHYLAEVIGSWLRQNGRTLSSKYLIGESYGGYRVPRLAAYLQSDVGIGVAGITMVSPALDLGSLSSDDALSPLRWMAYLPSMAAGVKERRGEPLSVESLAPVEQLRTHRIPARLLRWPGE